MSFAREQLLWLLAALPVVALLMRAARARADRSVDAFFGRRARIEGARGGWLREIVALAFLVLAAAGPQVGTEEHAIDRPGLDVVVVLDASRSMWVEDMGAAPESRLDRARREIAALARSLEFGRIGLVSFAGAARVECPLTEDDASFVALLDGVSPATAQGAGSALGAGVDRAVAMHTARSGSAGIDRIVLLVSDGENVADESVLRDAIARARATGVRIDGVTVGTPLGGPVPEGDQDPSGFVQDEGKPAISRADPMRIGSVATATGGRAVRLDSDPLALQRMAGEWSAGRGASGREERPVDRYRWLVLVALVLLLVPVPARSPRGVFSNPRVREKAPLRIAFALLVLGATLGAADAIDWRDAIALHRAGRFDEAVRSYRAILAPGDDPAVRYDLGVALHDAGEFESAQAEFERAAASAPPASDLGGRARYGAGVALARRAANATGEREADLLRAARARFFESLRDDASETATAAAADLEIVTRRLLEIERAKPDGGAPGSEGGRPQDRTSNEPDAAGAAGPAGREPGTDAVSGNGAPTPDAARSAGSEPEDVGAPAGQSPGVEPAASRRARSIEEIVREFERKRIAYDRHQSAASRARQPRDW